MPCVAADMVTLTDFTNGIAALPGWQQSLLSAALIVIAGYLFMRFGRALVRASMDRNKHIDATLTQFVMAVISSVGWVVIVAAVLVYSAGVDLTAMLGGLAIGGFVIGFALKDTLGNLAAGVMLLFYRPFNLGDTVTISGETGDVTSLGMALTTLKIADGRLVTIPNGKVLGSAITNHTRAPIRRADVVVGISYDDDIDTAVKAIIEAVSADSRVLPDPAPSVRITALGASSVDLQVRPWVKTPDVWQAKADLHATVKRAVEAAGCSIPFPQQDVHIISQPHPST